MYGSHGDTEDKHDVTNWTKKYTEEFHKLFFDVINDVILDNKLDSHKPVTVIVSKKYKDIFDKEFSYIIKTKGKVKTVKYVDTLTSDYVGKMVGKDKPEFFQGNELLPRENGFSIYWNHKDKEMSFFVKFQKK